MVIFIKTKTKSAFNKVEKADENHFAVFTTEAPEKNRANQAVIELLVDYFNTPYRNVKIIRGLTSKNKVIKIEINEEK